MFFDPIVYPCFIPWKVGYRLGVVFQPNKTSPDVHIQFTGRVGFQPRVSSPADFLAGVDVTGHFPCEVNFETGP